MIIPEKPLFDMVNRIFRIIVFSVPPETENNKYTVNPVNLA